MTVSATPSIFDTFNARQMAPEAVARTFVPPPQLDDLAKSSHTLVIGPRGSGKTTLLKMLHPAALESWNHEEATKLRANVHFTGVFVAADLGWSEQVKALGGSKLDTATHQLLEASAYTTRILEALIESMRRRSGREDPPLVMPHRRVELVLKSEILFAREVAEAWHLSKVVPSFDGILSALRKRLILLDTIASQEAIRGPNGRSERIAVMEFLHLDFVSASRFGARLFNDLVKEGGGRWALLFDELELVPEWLRKKLLSYLRSVDEHFFFKLSLSPYLPGGLPQDDELKTAKPRQDFLRIQLWHPNKATGFAFCRQLFEQMVATKKLDVKSADEVFGESVLSTTRVTHHGKETIYRYDSATGRRFRRLAERDPSFALYLRRHRVDLRTMHTMDSNRRAAILRKGAAIIAIREYFRGEGKTLFQMRAQGRRSRKTPIVYAGAESMFAMVEGNPRWFIGIIGRLIERQPPGSNEKVSASAQVREVLEAAHIFRAMLKTVPCGPHKNGRRGLLSLLDPVGERFSNAAIDESFDPSPPGSFTVDSRTDPSTLHALGTALNAGAVVLVDDDPDSLLVTDLRGARLRLSYLLAPYYYTPLILGWAISLRKILDEAGQHGGLESRRQARLPDPSLFG